MNFYEQMDCKIFCDYINSFNHRIHFNKPSIKETILY